MIVFKVWIPGYGRRVWRRIEIPESETLHRLATAILEAYDFDDDHLYQFYFTRNPWERDQVTFVHPAADGVWKADKIRLSDLLVTTFNFLYDFGDQWCFKVRLEGKTERRGEVSISGRGEAPEQYQLAEARP